MVALRRKFLIVLSVSAIFVTAYILFVTEMKYYHTIGYQIRREEVFVANTSRNQLDEGSPLQRDNAKPDNVPVRESYSNNNGSSQSKPPGTVIQISSIELDFYHQLSQAIADPELQKLEAGKCLSKWDKLRKLSSSNILFYGLHTEIPKICEESILGNVFEPLPQFSSWCWVGRVTPITPYPFHFNEHIGPVYQQVRSLHSERIQAGYGTGWRMRCLPKLMVSGFNKCGTSDLYSGLIQHQNVFRSPLKEYAFWDKFRPGYHNQLPIISSIGKEEMTFSDYLDLQAPAAEYALETTSVNGSYHPNILVDATPAYMWNYHWGQISASLGIKGQPEPPYILADTLQYLLPDVNLLVMMRNPTDRAYSACKFYTAGNCDPMTFHGIMLAEMTKLDTCMKKESLRGCAYMLSESKHDDKFLTPGLYYIYIQDWLEVFNRRQFLFIRAEDYFASRQSVLSQVFSFLNLDNLPTKTYFTLDQSGVSNHASSHTPMLAETKQLLDNFYRPYNEKLANLLGDKKYIWED